MTANPGKIDAPSATNCPTCHGTGSVTPGSYNLPRKTCSFCGGSGLAAPMSETGTKDNARLLWLETVLKHCPHADLTYNDDADDGPIGWSLVIESCSRMDLKAPTLEALIDLGMSAEADEDGNVVAETISATVTPQGESSRADSIVDAYLEKSDRVYPDGTSAEDIERDLRDPIRQLERELAIVRGAAQSYHERLAALQSATLIPEIAAEVARARAKHPEWPTDTLHAAAIVSEESGELMRAAVQHRGEGGSIEACDKEAVQTAATCIRFLERR